MKVAFDSRASAEENGVGRYSRCITKALRETAADSDEIAETRRPASTVRARNPDVFHAPWMSAAMLHSPCPQVVTIHDLAALKRRSEQMRSGLRLRLRNLAVQRAISVIVPTEAVAQDAVDHLGLERERIVVVPEAADDSMYPRNAAQIQRARAAFELPERYLVWVGGLQHPVPGRHLAKLAASPRELPLVLVGPSRPWVRELPDVILTGRVSDEQLAAIYSGAHALVIGSEDEGFGLPAVEALACGTPVVAYETPALCEALGGRASFVEPGDVAGLLTAAHAATRPAPPPSSWTWRDAARATWIVYAGAVAASSHDRIAARSTTRPQRRQSLGGLEIQ